MRPALIIAALSTLGISTVGASAGREILPHLQRNGAATQLMVDGAPYLALAGELHNSSASSPAYMAPVWDSLQRRGVRTVIGTASWELVEPQEGRYDFSAVDDQIRQARAHGIRIVMIWFGAYKNAESKYAPTWVRKDEVRFPRARRATVTQMGAFFTTMLTVHSKPLVDADARAFAALMRHIKMIDKDRTVIMMQVENEVGLLGESRDRSALSEAAWAEEVPALLTKYLTEHRAELKPSLLETWARNGFRTTGSWSEVFGSDALADEIFMAWSFGRYLDRVASAGAAELALPMFANAWLGPQPGAMQPGQYPSGGPVARMMDVWKAAAPSLALLAPDIYIDDFQGTLAAYRRADNPIFVPEAKFDAGNLFLAIGQHAAIGFSPFGIEDGADDQDVFKAYHFLNEMSGLVTRAQSDGTIQGFKLIAGSKQTLNLGAYAVGLAGPGSTLGAFGAGTGSAEVKTRGYGLIIQNSENDFLIVGRGISPTFTAKDAEVEVDSAQEGTFRNGQWVPGRTLNGDERYGLFPTTELRAVRITLLRRPK